MTKRKSPSYLAQLANPRTGVLRKAALQVLQLSSEMADATFPDERNDASERYLNLDCVSCDAKMDRATLYCSDYCQQLAGTVRYVRKAVAERRVVRTDVQEGIGMRLLMLTGGGYATKMRALSKRQREAIFARDHFKCKLCGGDATEIDHIAGDSSSPNNLRALCKDCNGGAAVGTARIITRDGNPEEWKRIQQMYEHIAQRIAAPRPLRFCDNYVLWNKAQGAIRGARRKLLRDIEAQDDTDFEDVDDYLYNAMQKDD